MTYSHPPYLMWLHQYAHNLPCTDYFNHQFPKKLLPLLVPGPVELFLVPRSLGLMPPTLSREHQSPSSSCKCFHLPEKLMPSTHPINFISRFPRGKAQYRGSTSGALKKTGTLTWDYCCDPPLLSGQPPHPALLSVPLPHSSLSPLFLCPAPLWSTGPGQPPGGWQGTLTHLRWPWWCLLWVSSALCSPPLRSSLSLPHCCAA